MPPVLLHGKGNTLGFALLGGGFLTFQNELFGSLVPGTLTITLAYGLLAALVLRRNRERAPTGATAVAYPAE